jgi:membrane protease YdiL (CAAX protease family)
MSAKTKLFAILWIAGWMGVLSFLLVDLSAFLAALPVTAGKPMPFPPLVVKLLSVIQSTIFLSVAVFLGRELAPKVGLSSPVAEAVAKGGAFSSVLKPQIAPGLIGGLAGGIAIVASWVLARPFLPPAFVARAEEFNKLLPFLTRLLYGGITEELLIRWGLMTFFVWIAWRLLQKGQGRPQAVYFVCAIVLSSLLFGLGHLPLAFAIMGHLTASIIFYVVIANSVFGLIAGYLYWKKGLESAIIAHMMAHVVIVTASHFA